MGTEELGLNGRSAWELRNLSKKTRWELGTLAELELSNWELRNFVGTEKLGEGLITLSCGAGS